KSEHALAGIRHRQGSRPGRPRSPRTNEREDVSTSLLDKRHTRIRRMFAAIAPSYDLLNHLLSLNIDKYWRWRTTRLAPPAGSAPILDLCTGTGDLALAYDRAAGGRAPIIGADFCHEMLVRALQKTGRRHASDRVRYLEADFKTLHFPFKFFQITQMTFTWIIIAVF